MAGRKKAILSTSEKTARAEERAFKRWQAKYQGKPPPEPRMLRHVCQHLVANPHQIQGPNQWEIYHALKGFLANTPWPRLSSKEVGEEVNIQMEGGLSLGEARQETARLLKMSIEAVKQAHIRHGRAQRDKSR